MLKHVYLSRRTTLYTNYKIYFIVVVLNFLVYTTKRVYVVIHSNNAVEINVYSLRWNCLRPKIALGKCQGTERDNVTDGGSVW